MGVVVSSNSSGISGIERFLFSVTSVLYMLTSILGGLPTPLASWEFIKPNDGVLDFLRVDVFRFGVGGLRLSLSSNVLSSSPKTFQNPTSKIFDQKMFT